jgi:hypothetical protein
MDLNLSGIQSLASVLGELSTDLGTNGADGLAQALVSGGLGEPRELAPVDQYRAFIEAWSTELAMKVDAFAAYSRICQALADALTGADNSAAAGFDGQ